MCDFEQQNCEFESSAGSCDIMWESVKIDIDQSRASQDEKLQRLKGRLLKQQKQQKKIDKCSRGIKKAQMKKKSMKGEGIFRKALEIITNAFITRKIKERRKFSFRRIHSIPAMKFVVAEKSQSVTNGNDIHPESTDIQQTTDLSSPHRDKNNSSSGPKCRDQSVQVEDLTLFHSKDTHSDCQECQHKLANRYASKAILLDALNFPVYVNPVTCGMNVETLNPCCNHRGKASICTSHCETKNHQPTTKVIADQSIQTDDQTVSHQIPWRQLCEELRLRFCSQDVVPVGKSADSVSLELKRLTETLQNLQSNLISQSSNQMAPAVGASPQNSAFAPTVPPPLVLQLETSPELSPHIMTPDLLVDSKRSYNTRTHGLAGHHEETAPTDKSSIKTYEPELLALSIAQKEDNSKKQDCSKPAAEVDVAKSKNVDDKCKDKKSLENHVTSSEMDTDIVIVNITRDALNDIHKKKENVVQEKSCPNQNLTLTAVKRHLFNSGAGETKTAIENCSENSSQQKSIEKAQQSGAPMTEKAVAKADANPVNDKRDKVLSLIQENSFNVPCDEIRNSPAFEEMDSSELENLLLVWRQQEQLHQDQGKRVSASSSRASSPNFLFRKLKRTRELPLELQTVKVLQPPPLQKQPSSDISALDMLEKEALESIVEEDDEDVPETQMPVILQPKKRRLRLQNSRLSLKNNSPPLPVVFQRSNDLIEPCKSNKSGSNNNGEGTTLVVSGQTKLVQHSASTVSKGEATPETEKNEENTSEETCVTEKNFTKPRASKRLKSQATSEKEKKVSASAVDAKQDCKSESGKKDSKSFTKPHANKKQSKKGKNMKENDIVISPPQEGNVMAKLCEAGGNAEEIKMDKSSVKDDFVGQIKERLNKVKKDWLHERSLNESEDANISDLFPSSDQLRPPSPSENIICNEGILISQDEMKILKEVPVHEVGKAHDLATHVLVNPWRGINAKQTTKGFVCPPYDTKSVVRALWDLRSNAPPESIIGRIIDFGWNGFHPVVLKAIVSMFIVALSRHVPFVIEDANSGEDDDTCSVVSDTDQNSKKKYTPLRLVATQPIFKGECIEGLRGLIFKVSAKDKDSLKSWNLPKFNRGRNWAVFGPVAYLKRKESNFNTEAILLSENLIAAKASRNILRGERLFVSYNELEK